MQAIYLLGGFTALSLFCLFFYSVPVAMPYTALAVCAVAWEYPTLPNFRGLPLGISIVDVFALAGVIVVIARIISQPAPDNRRRLLWIPCLLLLTLLFSVFRGTLAYPTITSLNEARLLVVPVFFLVWAASLHYNAIQPRDIYRLCSTAIAVLTIVALYHAIRYGIGGPASGATTPSGLPQTGRILTAPQAAMLALAFLGLIFLQFARHSKFMHYVLAVSAVLVLVLAQHRSVWTAVFLSGLITFLGISKYRKGKVAGAVAWSAALLVAVGLLLDSNPVTGTLIRGASDERTYDARNESLSALFSTYLKGDPVSLMFGQGFGGGWARYEGSNLVTYSPHNWYIAILLRAGVSGLLLWVGFIVLILLRSVQQRDPVCLAIAVFVSTYAWSYSIQPFLIPIAGVLLLKSISPPGRRGETRSSRLFAPTHLYSSFRAASGSGA